MVVEPVHSPTDIFTRSFAFTLATGLAWLGHDRPCDCPRMATEHPARVWFKHLPPSTRVGSAHTLVVVDLAEHQWPASRVRGLLGEVNHCTGRDQIRVRERKLTDRGDWADQYC
jgi:hypothetical protein